MKKLILLGAAAAALVWAQTPTQTRQRDRVHVPPQTQSGPNVQAPKAGPRDGTGYGAQSGKRTGPQDGTGYGAQSGNRTGPQNGAGRRMGGPRGRR